jgi:hypothetical protein
MTIALIAAFCVVLLLLAFLFPRLSRRPERGGRKAAGVPTKATSRAPGKLGVWLSKPFRTGQRAITKSGSTGRKGRSKLPF